MAFYTVHVPPGRQSNLETAERIALIKEGFSLWALVAPLFWLLWNRLWLVFAAYILAVLLLETTGAFAGVRVGFVLTLVFALWFASEARNLMRWTLGRRGWREVAVVEADSRTEAERRFFSSWLKTVNPPPPVFPARSSMPPADSSIVGMFPTPPRTMT